MTAMLAERDWRRDAACRTEDAELFFGLTAEDEARAVAVCVRCPVTDACKEWADRLRIVDGVWAGETEQQRRQRLSGRTGGGGLAVCEQCGGGFLPRRPENRFCSYRCHHASMTKGPGRDCGTTAAARRHRKRGEPVDPACSMAESLYRAQLRARRREAVSA